VILPPYRNEKTIGAGSRMQGGALVLPEEYGKNIFSKLIILRAGIV
jgi:hypothetical protein